MRSKLEEFIYKDTGTNICGHSNCDICKIFYWYSYWYNQYKSNIKLNGEGRCGFKQEKLIEYFFLCSHNGTHDQEAREDFWIFHLDTLHPQGLNQKRALEYWINWFSILMSILDFTLLGHTYKNIIAWIITNTSI